MVFAVVLELDDDAYEQFRNAFSVGEDVLWNTADNEEGSMFDARIAMIIHS